MNIPLIAIVFFVGIIQAQGQHFNYEQCRDEMVTSGLAESATFDSNDNSCSVPGTTANNPVPSDTQNYFADSDDANDNIGDCIGTCIVPGTPTKSGTTNVETTSFILNWNVPSGSEVIESYRVEVTGQNAVDVAVGTTTLEVSDLTANTDYQVSIYAENVAGRSRALTFQQTTLAGPPGNLNSYDVTAHSAAISWSAPEGGSASITSYRVLFESSNAQSESMDVLDYPLSTTIDSLDSGTTYTVTVQALNSYGAGKESNEISVTTNYGAQSNGRVRLMMSRKKILVARGTNQNTILATSGDPPSDYTRIGYTNGFVYTTSGKAQTWMTANCNTAYVAPIKQYRSNSRDDDVFTTVSRLESTYRGYSYVKTIGYCLETGHDCTGDATTSLKQFYLSNVKDSITTSDSSMISLLEGVLNWDEFVFGIQCDVWTTE